MTYTTRQQQIINHFRNVYKTYGKNAETYPIFVWRDEDELGFIFVQEIDEVIAMGCTYFVAIAPKTVNMWTSTDYRIHQSIVQE